MTQENDITKKSIKGANLIQIGEDLVQMFKKVRHTLSQADTFPYKHSQLPPNIHQSDFDFQLRKAASAHNFDLSDNVSSTKQHFILFFPVTELRFTVVHCYKRQEKLFYNHQRSK